jgi:hypothetical protein
LSQGCLQPTPHDLGCLSHPSGPLGQSRSPSFELPVYTSRLAKGSVACLTMTHVQLQHGILKASQKLLAEGIPPPRLIRLARSLTASGHRRPDARRSNTLPAARCKLAAVRVIWLVRNVTRFSPSGAYLLVRRRNGWTPHLAKKAGGRDDVQRS